MFLSMKTKELSSDTVMSKSNSPPTELGTSEIHSQHKIMVEGGPVPRARVLDQTMIDSMLMSEDRSRAITLAQHQAGEFLLAQASAAGIYCATSKMDGMPTGGPKKTFVPTGIFPMGKTLKLVEKECSEFHAFIVQEVVCFNRDIRDDLDQMKVLREALDCISNRRMAGGMNPTRHID